ncbi:hypothetical protein ABT275_36015 [Streptomyces sp. NPDC001185]|uniref:hypothetical protein n=1 Tax=Streptomyces sp. NPDC001185 TaxID=3154380 RepID=UPI00332FF772
MSQLTPISLEKAPGANATVHRRRRITLITAGGLVIASAGAVLFAWEPWVDRTPFVARTYVVAGAALFTDEGDGVCRPKESAGKRKLLGEDRRVLATGWGSQGEILSSRYGDAAGKCLYYTEYRDVPAGEDAYYEAGEEKFYTRDGERYETKLAEADLRRRFEEVKKSYPHFKAPAD